MQKDEVAEVVRAVLEEERRRNSEGMDEVVLKTVATILTSFGIDEEDRLEFKADIAHLRRWRKSVEQVQGYTFRAVITVLVGGFLGALLLGIKAMLGK